MIIRKASPSITHFALRSGSAQDRRRKTGKKSNFILTPLTGHSMENSQNKKNKPSLNPSPLLIGIVMTILVFFLPFAYRRDLGPGPDSVMALIWEYIEAPWQTGFWFVRGGIFLTSLIYTFPRFIFLFRIIQFYSIRKSRSSVIKTGILSAFFPGLISLVGIVGWQLGWTQPPPPISDPWFPVYIPLPALLIIGLLLVFLLPPDQSKTEVEPGK